MPRYPEDLTGRRFGKLTVSGYAGLMQQKNQKVSVWDCICDCGNACVVPGYLLKQGRRKSCGCIRLSGQEMVGKRYGHLVVEAVDQDDQTTLHKVICICDCGRRVSIATKKLKNGSATDCGHCNSQGVVRLKRPAHEKEERMRQRIGAFCSGKITNKSSLEVWCDIWTGYILPNVVKEVTISMYEDALERHILPFLGDLALDRLSEPVIRGWIEQLKTLSFEGKRPLAEGTLRNTLSILSGCLRDAQKAGIIRENPCQSIDWTVKNRNLWKEHDWLNEEQIKNLEPYLDAYRDEEGYPLGIGYELVLFTGMSLSEAVALRWGDIDLQNQKVHIRRFAVEKDLSGKEEETYGVEAAVGRRKRDVPIPDRLKGKLEHIRDAFGVKEEEYVIHSEDARPVRIGRLRSALLRRGRICGIGDVTPQMLRDSFAMRAVHAGVASDTLAELMGFASPQQVIRRYMPEPAEDKVELMNRIFRYDSEENLEVSSIKNNTGQLIKD